ncbi:rhoptry neck protein 3, putative [Plasmodium vivax]|uniref:Rhoptry neck protein 3, putative n=1 Tax=Plasmodium vivax TaxID=5855 RepID=A0A565A3A5_PLAVI|nr:rhoptry neck protein 3, putative [Plasmodium vivax]
MKKYWFCISAFYLCFNILSKCKEIENKSLELLAGYKRDESSGNSFKNREAEGKHDIKINNGSNYNEYSFLSLKASSIFNQHYVAKLINTILYRGLLIKGKFHKNVAIYESLSRTNYFFYLTVLNKKNVKRIVKLISRAHDSRKKHDVFRRQLIAYFDSPPFPLDNAFKNEMDHALMIYKKAKTDAYWGMVDALKNDGLLLARTFMSVSFVQSLRGIIGVINHELIDLCFSNAYLYNHIASFDKLIMNNTFGVIMSYVFKSLLLFFYPLVIPFRGAFAFALSSFCISQLSKIVFLIYRNIKRLARISYRKLYSTILKFNVLKFPELQPYASKLLYGDALILVSKIWKLSYVNVTQHLTGKNLTPVLNNLFEKNLGTGFFEFSNSLFKYVIDSMEGMQLISTKEADLDKEAQYNTQTFKRILMILKITRKVLYYEESYMRLAVANLLTKIYTLLFVNVNYISKMAPKEFFHADVESEFRYIYEDQVYELFLQRISSDIIRKPFIKRNIKRINRGSIEFTLSLIKIKLLHYKPSLKFPYGSLYFDEPLKKQLNASMKLIIVGSTGIIASLVNYGEKYEILKKCPLEIAKNLNQTCNYSTFDVKKLLFPLNIFINLLIPLFLNYNDIMINKDIIEHMVSFFKVILDSKDLYLYQYLKNVVDTIKKAEGADLAEVNYDEEIDKLVLDEIHKVIDEVNNEKNNSLIFNNYSMKNNDLYLHNKDGHLFKFLFNDSNKKDSFSRLVHMHYYRNPLSFQVPLIKFEPSNRNDGSLVVGSFLDKFEGKLSGCYMCLKEDDDVLVVDLIHHVLWASGVDRFSAYIFSSMVGAVKQYFHQGVSWNRALLNMLPTEFYEVYRVFMEKTPQPKDRSQNIFIKRIKKYRFNLNQTSFSKMFKIFLENVLNKVNFFNTEEATIILIMSALYSLYKNIEKHEIPSSETYKLYQQKLIEVYYPVKYYAHHYESYTMHLLKEKQKEYVTDDESEGENKSDEDKKDATVSPSEQTDDKELEKPPKPKKEKIQIELPLDDELVQNTKSLLQEAESREEERNKIIDEIESKHGQLPHKENFPHLPPKCMFLLYYDFAPFIKDNIKGIEQVSNNLTGSTIDMKNVRNIDLVQTEKTQYASIDEKNLIKILCGTFLFLKKENISIEDIFKFNHANDAVKHLLIIVSLLRIEKKTNRYSWKKFLTLEKFLDQREKIYKTPMKYLYLKLLNVKRVFGFTHRKLLMALGKRIKGKRFMNILRYTTFFEILENAESINSIYPRAYIKFEDILMFSNVFHKFKFPIIRYTSSQETVRTMLNNFKLSPNTSINNEKMILRIYNIINLIIKKKYNYDLNELRKDKKYFEVHAQNKSEHILNDIKIKPIVDQYLSQLIGFIKLLTDMRFTNFLFLRNFYVFIKFYAVTGDLDYSMNSSVFYLASRNYLNFILNSIVEFENFKKFMEKIKRNNNIKKFPIDHYNFQTECYSVDDIKTYVFIPEDKEKINKYYEIMGYDINSFYKNYLLIDLFYDDLDKKNLDTYYQKIANATDYNIGPTSDIYIPGGRKSNRVIPNNDVEMLNETVQNYIYLEKFLDKTNIPSIPFVDFNIAQDKNGVSFNFTNRATTPPFYKENILDQFDIIGKSIIGKYYQKVKCSFVTYPFNLYYWLVLNPGKPRVETVGNVGLIKEADLMSKTDEEKELEEQKLDEQLVEDLFKEEAEAEEDLMEEEENWDDTTASEADISESEFEDDLVHVGKDSKPDDDTLSYVSAASDLSTGSFESVASGASNASTATLGSASSNSNASIDTLGSAASNASTVTLGSAASNASTATLGSASSNSNASTATLGSASSNSNASTATLQSASSGGSTISGSTTSVNFLQTASQEDTDWEHGIFQVEKESEMKKKFNQTNGVSFLQKKEMNPLPFVDTMIEEKNNNTNKENYGYFNRPYNMYVNKTNIYRNFSVIMKIVHTIISLNKFSVVSPVEIIKKGLKIMKGKNKFIKNHHLNPFINKMLLDINETVQKLKSSSEKGFIGSKTDIISLYRIVEFQLFNEFLIYPPMKRLTDRELRYVLQVINEGYASHIMKVKSKLKREHVVKDKIVRFLNTFKEYRNLFDDIAIDRLVQMFEESLDCKDIKCFDLLFNSFITHRYNNIIMSLTNKSETFNVLGEIFKDPAALTEVRVQVHETYVEPSRRQNVYQDFQLESNVVLHPKLTYNELLFSSLELSKKIEIWNSMYTLFNIRHIYVNIGYLLLGVKYHIKRSHRVFLHTFKFLGWLRKNKKNEIYIP